MKGYNNSSMKSKAASLNKINNILTWLKTNTTLKPNTRATEPQLKEKSPT
jgi:hypothetical protein